MYIHLILGFAGSFLVTVITGLILIPALRRMKAGQTIREDGPTWHASKQGTPTMGGLMFIAGITAMCLLGGIDEIAAGDYRHIIILVFSLLFGLIGFLDDYEKVKKKRNLGLTALQKLALQTAAAAVLIFLLRLEGHLSSNLYVPFFNVTIRLPYPVYLVLAVFIIVGCVNAVNITDGIDGLAAGVSVPVALCYAAISAAWSAGTAGAGYDGRGTCGIPDLQFLPRQGVYGGHRLAVLGRRRLRHGLRPGYAPGSRAAGPHLYRGDPVGHYSGHIFQALPREAHL